MRSKKRSSSGESGIFFLLFCRTFNLDFLEHSFDDAALEFSRAVKELSFEVLGNH